MKREREGGLCQKRGPHAKEVAKRETDTNREHSEVVNVQRLGVFIIKVIFENLGPEFGDWGGFGRGQAGVEGEADVAGWPKILLGNMDSRRVVQPSSDM